MSQPNVPHPVIKNHISIIQLMTTLGYPKDLVEPGVCLGIACMAAQASLVGEQQGLNDFFNRINLIENTILNINQVPKDKSLVNTEPDELCNILKVSKEQLVDLKAFFDGVFLYQQENVDHFSLKKDFKARTQFDNVSDNFNIVKPLILSKVESISMVDKNCGCFDINNLETFFNAVDSELKKLDKKSTPVIIEINNISHGTTLVYFPETKSYHFFNANRLLNGKKPFNNLSEKREEIWNSFQSRTKHSDTLALNFVVFSINDRHVQDNKWLSKICSSTAMLHVTNSSTNLELRELATKYGHIDVIEKLQFTPSEMEDALIIAARFGKVDMMKKLLEKDLIIGMHMKDRLISYAKTAGHFDAVKEVFNNDPFNKINININMLNEYLENTKQEISKKVEIIKEFPQYQTKEFHNDYERWVEYSLLKINTYQKQMLEGTLKISVAIKKVVGLKKELERFIQLLTETEKNILPKLIADCNSIQQQFQIFKNDMFIFSTFQVQEHMSKMVEFKKEIYSFKSKVKNDDIMEINTSRSILENFKQRLDMFQKTIKHITEKKTVMSQNTCDRYQKHTKASSNKQTSKHLPSRDLSTTPQGRTRVFK